MLFNYLKTGLRAIFKQKLFSAINIFGLSFSLSVCMVMIMLLADQFSYDRFNTNHDHIYQVNIERFNEPILKGMATTPVPLGPKMKADHSQVLSYTRFIRGFGNGWINIMQDVNIPVAGFFADPQALDIFQYDLAEGNANQALNEPFQVVLTHQTALKLFGKTEVLGEMITVGELGTYQVTGVMKPIEGKTHIKFDALASMASYEALVKQEKMDDLKDNWSDRWNAWNYVQLAPGTDKTDVEIYLSEVSAQQYKEAQNAPPSFYLQKITDINPGPMIGNAIGPGIPMLFVYFLAGMALVIILSACFNYTNLSLARSLNRAREVGVRKVFGASRLQIITQFLAESILISIFAFICSLGILSFIKPVFLELNFSQLLDWNLSQSFEVYVLCFSFSIFVGLAAGIVPSLFHSSVRAMEALKSLAGVKVFSKMGMRNFLIVSQFGLSLFLIITVKLVYNQMNFMIQTDYGFDSENIVVVRLNGADAQLLQNEIEKYPNLISSSLADFVPASGTSSTTGLTFNEAEYTFNRMSVDHAYIGNMGLDLVAGGSLLEGQEANKVIINESAAKALQFDFPRDAVGQQLLMSDSTYSEIIGVVADYHHETMFSAIRPLMLFHDPERLSILQVQVNSTNFTAALHDIEKAWATVNPDLQIDYKIMNEEIAFFAELIFGDLSKIVTFVSLLALIIAALGLMGMVVYAMQVRMKEVSIRKVLGSTNGQLVYVLSRKFLKLLLIAIVFSLPLTYFINNLWLEAIAYSVSLSIGVILFGVAIIVLLGAMIVGSQTWKTANTNPSEILRYE